MRRVHESVEHGLLPGAAYGPCHRSARSSRLDPSSYAATHAWALMVVLVGLVFAACGSAVSSSPAPVGSGSQTRTEAPTGTPPPRLRRPTRRPCRRAAPIPRSAWATNASPAAAGTLHDPAVQPHPHLQVPMVGATSRTCPASCSCHRGLTAERRGTPKRATSRRLPSVLVPGHIAGSYDPSDPRTFDGLGSTAQGDSASPSPTSTTSRLGGLDGVAMDLSMKGAHGDGCSEGDFADVYVGGDPTKLVHAVGPDYPMWTASPPQRR